MDKKETINEIIRALQMTDGNADEKINKAIEALTRFSVGERIDELDKTKENLDSDAREVVIRRIQQLRSGNGEKGCEICGAALTKEEQTEPCPDCKKLSCLDCWENEKCCKQVK